MFSGLRSLWMTPLEWANCKKSSRHFINSAASFSLKWPCKKGVPGGIADHMGRPSLIYTIIRYYCSTQKLRSRQASDGHYRLGVTALGAKTSSVQLRALVQHPRKKPPVPNATRYVASALLA